MSIDPRILERKLKTVSVHEVVNVKYIYLLIINIIVYDRSRNMNRVCYQYGIPRMRDVIDGMYTVFITSTLQIRQP